LQDRTLTDESAEVSIAELVVDGLVT